MRPLNAGQEHFLIVECMPIPPVPTNGNKYIYLIEIGSPLMCPNGHLLPGNFANLRNRHRAPELCVFQTTPTDRAGDVTGLPAKTERYYHDTETSTVRFDTETHTHTQNREQQTEHDSNMKLAHSGSKYSTRRIHSTPLVCIRHRAYTVKSSPIDSNSPLPTALSTLS